MTSQHYKLKRWRPRFTVRILVIVVTLLCCYAACWGPTKRAGKSDVYRHVATEEGNYDGQPEWVNSEMADVRVTSAVVPFIVGIDGGLLGRHRGYYFWLFGYVAKLPYEREVPDNTPYDRLFDGKPTQVQSSTL